ncbi:anaerobic C4-dicarboxylate transporter [Vibrio cholerae]|nr:anaerobic C4-dicarboxylate transporter [Vibrio cholerae]
MIWVELAIVLLFIFIGARIGGIGIGLAGGAGVIALSLILGVPTKQAFIPVDVILIIMSVITAIAAMQVAGGWIGWSNWPKTSYVNIRKESPSTLRLSLS